MNINATLIGQAISFAIFVLFCMKFVWPPIIQAIEERQQKIEDGLNAAEKAKSELHTAQQEAETELNAAKVTAAELVEKANQSANKIVAAAKVQAVEESDKIKQKAQNDLEQEIVQTRESLREEVAALAVEGAEKIIRKDVNKQAHSEMLENLAAKL